MMWVQNEVSYEDFASKELAIKLQISVPGAKRVLKLKDIVNNEDAWEFLKDHSMLGVFADSHFTKAYSSIKNGGGTLFIEFVEAFMNGGDAEEHEERLKSRARGRKRDAISLSFCADARNLCVSMFFKIAAVVSTLSSFLSPDVQLDKIKLLDLTGRYLGDNWTSVSMQRDYQTRANLMCLVDGWNLVNEAMKVQVQELRFWKTRQQGERTGSESDVISNVELPGKNCITAEDIKEKVFYMCSHVISEFFAWCFQFVLKTEGLESFMDSVLESVDNICVKLTEQIGVETSEDDQISETLLRASLQSIANGHPTMAEIKYDAKEMNPSKREARLNASKRNIAWSAKDVITRCRWDESPVCEVYSHFLSKHQVEQEPETQEAKKVRDSPAPPVPTVERTSSASQIHEMEVPGTPEPSPEVGSRKRNYEEISGHATGVYHIGGKGSKRAKEILLRTSRRLFEASTQDRIARGRKLKKGYSDDAEDSDEERYLEEDEGLHGSVEEDMVHATNLSVQLLYETILDWPVLPVANKEIEKDRHRLLPPFDANNPATKAERSAVSDLLLDDNRWAKLHCHGRARSFLQDVTDAKAQEEYSSHWRNIIPIEIRAMISDAVSDLLPKKKENPSLDWATEIDRETFILFRVHNVSLEKGVINTVCKSLQPTLNKEVATKMQGGTICLGYTEGERDLRDERGKRIRAKQFSNP